MKKVLFFIMSVVLLGACTDQSESIAQLENAIQNEIQINEFELSETEALKAALPTLKALYPENSSRSNSFKVKRVERINNRYDSRSEGSNGLYLFNFEENGGFALVSADVRDSVFVYLSANEGYLPLGVLQDERNGLGLLLNLVESYQKQEVAEYVDISARDYKDYSHYVNVTTYLNIPSVISVHWDQMYPFNIYRNDGSLMGCIPVALGQLMTNYKSPTSIVVNNTQYSFDWDKICNITSYEVAENNLDGTYEVSKLLNVIGEVGRATYGTSGTSVSTGDVFTILDGFGYKHNSLQNFSADSIYSEVRNNRAVYMSGRIGGSEAGHAWLAVGASKIKTEYIAYDTETGELIENDILGMYSYTEYEEYININWGWGHTYKNNVPYSMYSKTEAELYPTRIYVHSGAFYTTKGTFDTNIWMITGICKK